MKKNNKYTIFGYLFIAITILIICGITIFKNVIPTHEEIIIPETEETCELIESEPVLSPIINIEPYTITIDDLKNASIPHKYRKSIIDKNGVKEIIDGKYAEDDNLQTIIEELSEVPVDTWHVISSGPEDDMIYTVIHGGIFGSESFEVLFVNEPQSHNFVAASYTNKNSDDYSHYLFDSYIRENTNE